jgi:hypothetical protein
MNNLPSLTVVKDQIQKSYFENQCNSIIDKNNIEDILNVDVYDYLSSGRYRNIGDGYLIDNNCYNYYSKPVNYNELYKNRGTRMIKHNLTNNIPPHLTHNDRLRIENMYSISSVYLYFPLISIYDEYEYIKLLISNIADIYNLPIIPPIKFI